MSDDDVHIVQRTPPMQGQPLVIPARAEAREQIEVTFTGGPNHGEKMMVWVDARIIRVPYAPAGSTAAEVPETEVKTVVDEKGVEVVVVETGQRARLVSAVTAVYERADEKTTVATFKDFEV